MNRLPIISLAMLVVACSTPSSTEQAISTDTTLSIGDSIVTPVNVVTTTTEAVEIRNFGEFIIEGEDTIANVGSQWSFISDPYDFPLNVESIKQLLGEEVESTEENFEGGEDYGPYSYYTVTYKDSEMSFYDYQGKHFSTITTPLLPLKRGISIGMSKSDFLNAFNFAGDSIRKVTLFHLYDDYGSMDFRFRADTLNLITASYEEGD